MTLQSQDKWLYRISIPKMKEWEDVEEGQELMVSVDKAITLKYGKLYNLNSAFHEKVNINR